MFQDPRPAPDSPSDSSLVLAPLQLPGPFSALAEDSFSPCCPKVGGPETPSATGPETQGGAPRGPGGCRLDCGLGLGRTRSVWPGVGAVHAGSSVTLAEVAPPLPGDSKARRS